ncbi:hypothetical protein [Endozoicomonas atrinae]|uniref:hypothetical protein n=1 Tax=Endozoicomonas atrinae TaxID=1333660 RepID=UPI000826701B|nr:hypothetical protein [Endozoicomonas atrinae]
MPGRSRVNYSTPKQAEPQKLKDDYKALKEKAEESGKHRSHTVAKTNVANATPVKPTPAQNSNQPPVPKAPVAPPTAPPLVETTSDDQKTGQTDNRSVLLNAIIKGPSHGLRKVAAETSTSKPKAPTTFMPAAAYLFNASWGTWKEKLTSAVIASGGKPGDNEHLNLLMEQHAKYAKKTGVINAVSSDIDAVGKAKASGIVSKTVYEGYVAGREQKSDRNNDFKQSIDSFLDQYLGQLSEESSKSKTGMKAVMQERFGLATVVQTPQTFFLENKELNGQLVEAGLKIEWLNAGDITEQFIDALIHYDEEPERITPFIDEILARERRKYEAKEADLDSAQKKHKSKLSKLFGKNN